VVDSIQLRWRPRANLYIPGVVVMLPYLVGLGAFVYFASRTRHKAPFYLYMAAILCGLAILAKGLAGLGLPVIVFLAYLLFTWNWGRLKRAGLLPGLLVALLGAAVVAIPWHHAMLVRHGFPFWDELYGDNHWRRLVTGRHGDRGSFEYFLRELGYAVLPWIALAPSALAWVVMRPFRKTEPVAPPPPGPDAPVAGITAKTATKPDAAGASAAASTTAPSRPERRQDIFWFGAIWFVAGYAVVSMSMTKFHHYILPALPGLAIAIGCFLDDVVTHGRRQVALAAAFIGAPLLALVTHDLVSSQQNHQHFIWLFSYDYVNAPGGRPWPQELDYRAPLIGFSAAFGLIALLGGVPRLTRHLPAAMAVAATAFTVFLLDVYVPETATRWSQKGLIKGYYEQRKSPDERLVAWQLYWRGETFYTANEIFEGPTEGRTVFLGDRNAEMLKEWVGRNRGKRAFFVVERARLDGLRGLLPPEAQPSLRVLDQTNNKFYLAVAQL
jgi:hypothetical protein